nr:O-antigen ligase family protein [Ruminococcus sp. AM36-18]
MNVGIALLLSKYFSSQKLKKIDILMLFVFIVSLMLTGKRTLFIIPVLSFALFMVISNIKGKFAKTGGIVLSALSAVFILSMFIPKVANIFDRFMDEENIMALGNRDSLWKYFLLMGEKYPVFGAGFGSYNQFAYDNGLRVGGARWNFNGHNCYFQIAVELGIVGSIFFLLFAVLSVVLTILAIRRVKNICDDARICYFSLYIQIMILAYSVTGNPTYSRQIMFIWFFSIGAVLHIARKHNIDIVINKESERRHL